MDTRDVSYWLATAGDDLTPRPALDGSTEADVAILGAGLTGLWTAFYLARRDPSLRIVILERETAGFGASGRNGAWCAPDLNISMSTEMKLAGGKEYGDTLRVEEFIHQAEQYETGGDAWDTVLKIMNTVMRTHPMHTVRAAELLRWHRSGGYDKILAGDYVRRGQNDSDQPLSEDYVDAAGYYGQKTRETVETFKDGLRSAKDAVSSAWRNR